MKKLFSPYDSIGAFTELSILDEISEENVIDDICINTQIPLYPYTFKKDLYKSNNFIIPRHVFQIQSKGSERSKISINLNMPNWKYFIFSGSEQQEFISKFFPEKISMYRSYAYKEQKDNLFIYLWLYMNGGVYIASDYQLMKPLDSLLDGMGSGLYFTYDKEKHISTKFFASAPFCDIWLKIINKMEKLKNIPRSTIREEIDKNTGRGLLRDLVNNSSYEYEILPHLYPYSECETIFDEDSYFNPSSDQDIMTYMKCKTNSNDEMIYVAVAVIFAVVMLIIIAMISN